MNMNRQQDYRVKIPGHQNQLMYLQEVKRMSDDSRDKLLSAISILDERLSTQTDEHELLKFLDSALLEFEAMYRADRRSFSDDVVDKLKAARECHRALPSFIEICEDIEDVPIKEEAEDLMHRLHEIAVHFGDFAVRARIEKEYRGLREQLNKLPSAGGDPYEMERNRRISILNREAPTCEMRNCGSPMVISASKTSAWWRCSTFPKCFSRKSLTKKQRAYLEKA
jgi:hypothetical protein